MSEKHFYLKEEIYSCTEFKLALDYSVNSYDSRIVKEAPATKSLLLIIAQIKKNSKDFFFEKRNSVYLFIYHFFLDGHKLNN